MSCLPLAGRKITNKIIAHRTDLCHISVVSIDPPGWKDIDDALHCVRLPNGRLQAGGTSLTSRTSSTQAARWTRRQRTAARILT